MEVGRYSAFISYSHADTKVAEWLHHALETYRMPKQLVGQETPNGTVTRRLKPVFRDRDELPASGDLGAELRNALAEADFQIVICSERAAKSKWVNEEILSYKRLYGEKRTFAVIAGGEPYSADRECFPEALRFVLGADGQVSDQPAEPIAADIRPGKDGRRLALLKLLAGITGAKLDQLVRRDEARRRRRLAVLATISTSVAVVTLALAFYANTKRIEANIQRQEAVRQKNVAEEQRRTAEASLDFLIGTFEIANPATENPRTISAITLLNRVSDRVKTELKAQPKVSARLLRATGEIYLNLGLPNEAERDLRGALTLEVPGSETRAVTYMQLARTALDRNEAKEVAVNLDKAAASFNASKLENQALVAELFALRGRLGRMNLDWPAAETALNRSLLIYEAMPGDNRLEIARILIDRGQVKIRTDRQAEAQRDMLRAEQIYLAVYGRNHVVTAKATQNRALAAFEPGNLDEATMLIARAVETYTRVNEADHPNIATASILQGRIAHARNDLPQATEAFARAAGIFGRIYGLTSARTGDANYYLAQVYSDRSMLPEALNTINLTKRAYDESYGPDDYDQAGALTIRAQIERKAGRLAEARRDCMAGVETLRRIKSEAAEIADAREHCEAMLAQPPAISLLFREG